MDSWPDPGRTDGQDRNHPAEDSIAAEGDSASMVVLGLEPGNAQYARGVQAWILWWRGVEALPSWLRRPLAPVPTHR